MSQASARERMERFAQEFRNGDIEVALTLIDGLLADHPEQAPLHWQRARVLQSMGRLDEAREAVDRVLEMRPTHALTWLMRAELVADADSSEAALRRAIEIDPRLARAHLLLSRQLAHDGRRAEAEMALGQALQHDPHQPEAWTLRGDWHREAAALGVGKVDPDDPDQIAGIAGHRYSRLRLLAARADYETSLGLRNDPRVRLWLALVLQALGEHDAALAQYDAVLALTPLDDPDREGILAERACSLDGGRNAERVMQQAYAEALWAEEEVVAAQTAALAQPAAAVAGEPQTAAPAGTPPGLSRSQAEALCPVSGDEERMAFEIAWSIYRLGHTPATRLRASELASFPRFMREWAQRCAEALDAQGFRVLGDYQPETLSAQSTEPTLLRYYVAGDGVTFGESSRTRPKWTGLLGFLALKWKGQWSPPGRLGLTTMFDDGGAVLTSNGSSHDVIGYGGRIDQCKLAADAGPAVVNSRHRERIARYRREHPHVTAERADTAERVFALVERLERAKCAWRRQIGYVNDEELRLLLGERHETLAPKVRAALSRMAGG